MIKKILFSLCFFASVICQNTHPIVLIHGFLGWGRDEVPGYYYWGGKTDLENILNNSGYRVYSVSVGPISSNFDRAIETFYQIKGGQLDYGKTRSDTLGIVQKPKNKSFSGLYSDWNANNPIHIIGHSMGGQTARMLEMLLKQTFPGEESLLLSNEHRGWIKSITTISTPHNGSTLVPIMLNIFPFAIDLAPWLAGVDINSVNQIYSFDLEHWQITRGENESLLSYYRRLGNSPLAKSKNLCSWDLSPEGATHFNQTYVTDSLVYYFSMATTATREKSSSGHHVPKKVMSLHLRPLSRLMGRYNHVINSNWYENDGICNTISMNGPENAKIIKYDGIPKKGVWQIMNKIPMDHQAVIGHHLSEEEMKNIIVLYTNHIRMLNRLK